ncbi:hypothetical protein EVAR_23018_1 [Eumeta japonica]|uniref:Uncharacterized protein n=1 Tax=Eumeta variegata TaxID=151549 RepID=A0A4C1UQ14_EUMVA|nr:hypothetical protein EVAR_23018_1 [Eumeta japonica]
MHEARQNLQRHVKAPIDVHRPTWTLIYPTDITENLRFSIEQYSRNTTMNMTVELKLPEMFGMQPSGSRIPEEFGIVKALSLVSGPAPLTATLINLEVPFVWMLCL